MKFLNVYPTPDTTSSFTSEINEYDQPYKKYSEMKDGFKLIHTSGEPVQGSFTGEALDKFMKINTELKLESDEYIAKGTYECGNGKRVTNYYPGNLFDVS